MISFIIVSYNTKKYLESCISSLNKAIDDSAILSEIIVVDNNSADGTREFLSELNIIKIFNNENLGFARACNLGALKARGDILWFINSDLEINSEALTRLNKAFVDYQAAGIIAPALLNQNNTQERFACGKFPNLARLILRRLAYNNLDKNYNEVDWVSGAALAVRSNIFKEVLGFDEKFFMYFEDIDLCFRIKKLGYKVLFMKDISVLHHHGKSLNKNSLRKKYYYNSQLIYFKKHFGKLKAYLLMIIRWPLLFKNL